LIDIYCTDGNCPICDSKMDIKWEDSNTFKTQRICKNDCYAYIGTKDIDDDFSIQIFDTFSCLSKKCKLSKSLESEIIKEIKYWKDNERYVMKLLMGDDYDQY
jgi:hypothetical protein